MFKKIVKKSLRTIAKPLFKQPFTSLENIAKAYQQVSSGILKEPINLPMTCAGIIFSKDRAMQLHALLSSYFHYVENVVPLQILYTTSNSHHQQSYDELVSIFKDKEVLFIQENNFRLNLLERLQKIDSPLIFFMTDDGLFINNFNLANACSFDPLKNVFSLIKGKDLDYCYIQNKRQPIPEFITPQSLSLTTGILCWEWEKQPSWSDWAYPLSLDTSFFLKKEIEMLIGLLDFKGPNSLEAALHKNFAPIFLKRNGLCYEKAMYVNVVCNVVNTEHKNRNTGTHSIESLLQKWNEGLCIQYELFKGKSCTEVEKASFTFTKRN